MCFPGDYILPPAAGWQGSFKCWLRKPRLHFCLFAIIKAGHGSSSASRAWTGDSSRHRRKRRTVVHPHPLPQCDDTLLLSCHAPQMPVYYYPSGRYPTSTSQQYRPLASVQYSAQRSQQIPQTAQPAGMWSLFPFCAPASLVLMVNLIHVPSGWVPKRDNLSHMFSLSREANKAFDKLCGKFTGKGRRRGVYRAYACAVVPHELFLQPLGLFKR